MSHKSTWICEFQSKRSALKRWDNWTLTFDYSLETDTRVYGWYRYVTSSFASFDCSSCSNSWSSARVPVLFHFKLVKSRQYRREAMVKIRLFKQECRRCESTALEEPEFSNENIRQVLDRLVTKIRQKCYNENVGRKFSSNLWDDEDDCDSDGPHETSLCEACRLGVCRKPD